MTTPAERYAAARERAARPAAWAAFQGGYDFPLDDFQVRACRALQEGKGVLVAAPTGAGKTVVGEFAVHLALESGRKCFYTTPIKALSNQKYHDLVRRYGVDRIGLLTGDNSVNGEAPVVVMTTEVLRNMLYSSSPTLAGLGYVVMDEVHYLADRFRGGVWEEVIIHLPEDVLLVALSATVSNAEEFGDWLGEVRGTTEIVVDEHRPVPLWQQVMMGDRLLDLFVDDEHSTVNPELVRLARDASRSDHDGRGRRGRRGRDRFTPWRTDVVDKLHHEHLLPGITFIFSRAGCDAAVQQCLARGIRLTTPEERARIEGIVEARTADLPHDDLGVLGFDSWVEGLRRGVAAHHAGLLPLFKEIVEELFQQGLVKVVFATETLALGINMPARSVVLERLVKWNGEAHVDITPGEYTQLTGRAGRRGIDVEGTAITVWHPGLDPKMLAGLASTRTYPLRSSFRPSYTMAVNLVEQMGRVLARDVLETSFAQFQADRAVVGLAAQIRRNEEALAGYLSSMTCHLGDFAEYAALRRALSDTEKEMRRDRSRRQREDSERALGALRVGDVVVLPTGRRSGPAVVFQADEGSLGSPPRPALLGMDRQVRRVSSADVADVLAPVGRLRVPRDFSARSAGDRRALAAQLREFTDEVPAGAGGGRRRRGAGRSGEGDDRMQSRIADLRARMRQHPCHGCADREAHARWAERYDRLLAETASLQQRVDARSHSIARQFDRVCDVLVELGYLEGEGDALAVTDPGRLLGGLYTDRDLLVAQCLREGLWAGLDPEGLVCVVAALVYEERQQEEAARLPGGEARIAIDATVRAWEDLRETEERHRVRFQRDVHLGFVWPAHRWARGARLAKVLEESELSAGDFVRWMRQVLDLLDQLADALPADDPMAARARAAMALVDRGVIAYASAL
ncbi:MAG: DEAD/DEAH box helicase [bacterium]